MRSPSPLAGYSLVMLMILLTVLNIAIAASLPAWSAVIRRDKEEELVFRGLQYAEAVRVFKNRFQRDPVRLEELIEVEPRSIRKLWKDPMTESGKWSLISSAAPGPPGGFQVEGPDEDGEDPGEDDEPEGEDDDGFGPKKDEIQVGPFKGVHSRSGKKSFLRFNGRDRYDEWHFTVDLFTGPENPNRPPPQQGIGPGSQMQLSARWIGRPLPEFLQPRQETGLPQNGSGIDPDGRQLSRGNSPRKP